MRLIDADALLEKMKKTDRYFNIVFDIEEAPTVDAVKATMPWIDPDGTERVLDEVSYEIGYAQGQKDTKRQGEWKPCSERLPKDLEVVNITWINHCPMTYYADIKDKPFTATAIHYKDKWWWYSPICEDMLAEYGKSECDKMDADIEVTAWMPLPEPWKGAENEID